MHMLTRRQILLAITALAGGTTAYTANSLYRAADRYTNAVRDTWRHNPDLSVGDALAVNRELVRYATLAASSHNTQCWKFKINPQHISILPDLTRRCAAVDPDDHHLFVSLGCATENLVQAAQALGQHGTVLFDATIADTINIALEPSQAVRSPLFAAIPQRQCTRTEYDGRTLSADDLKSLESAGTGLGVKIIVMTAKTALEDMIEYVVQGNTVQMNDRAFMEELTAWIRFGYDEVVSHRDGLFSAASGNPVVPRWLGIQLLNLFFTAQQENDKYAKHIRSSAGLAVFVSERDDPKHWVEVGRCYERFALQATALGLKNAFLNQPVEVTTLRSQFASYLGIGDHRPDLLVRFGYGAETPRSLRRPIDQVIIA